MYNAIIDQADSIRRRVVSLPEKPRLTLAIAAAQRLMDEYLELPEESREPFTATLVDLVSKLGDAITQRSEELDRELDKELKEYYAGPYSYELGEDALPGSDDDAASAAIYAAEAYCTDDKEAAAFAAMQLFHATTDKVGDMCVAQGIDAMSKEADQLRFQSEQIELDRLANAVSFLERQEFTETTLQSVITILKGHAI